MHLIFYHHWINHHSLLPCYTHAHIHMCVHTRSLEVWDWLAIDKYSSITLPNSIVSVSSDSRGADMYVNTFVGTGASVLAPLPQKQNNTWQQISRISSGVWKAMYRNTPLCRDPDVPAVVFGTRGRFLPRGTLGICCTMRINQEQVKLGAMYIIHPLRLKICCQQQSFSRIFYWCFWNYSNCNPTR